MLRLKRCNDFKILYRAHKIFASSSSQTRNFKTNRKHLWRTEQHVGPCNGDNKPKSGNSYVRNYSADIYRESSFVDCFMTNHGGCDECEVIDPDRYDERERESAEKESAEKESAVESDKDVNVDIKQPFKLHKLTDGPDAVVKLNKSQASEYYTKMLTIRHLEAASEALYKAKVIRGFCHLYRGQEACAVGIKAAMREKDNVITTYRCHGWCYMMKMSPHGILAELIGRQTGCQRSRGGSRLMHSPHFYGGQGTVGAQVPLGTGVAFSCKYKSDGGVCFAMYGDGYAKHSQIFESFNIASLWKLPIVFVCENNGRETDGSYTRNYYARDEMIPGIWVDGMDVLAVRSAAEFAIEYVAKNGPLVMEVNMCSQLGHSMTDPSVDYRSRGEVQVVPYKLDPIRRFRNLCLEEGLLTFDEIKTLDDGVRKDIDVAVEKSKNDPENDPKELTADIYSRNLESDIRDTTDFKSSSKNITKGSAQ